MSSLRKIRSIVNGLAYVEKPNGELEPMQLVVGRNGVIGCQPIDERQEAEASIDQTGPTPAVPTSLKGLGIDQA